MDVSSLFATQQYSANRPATAAEPLADIGGMAANAAQDFAQTLQETETLAKQAMTGGADPHALVQALAQTELAVETAVTMRDKVVQAYQEILRMPI